EQHETVLLRQAQHAGEHDREHGGRHRRETDVPGEHDDADPPRDHGCAEHGIEEDQKARGGRPALAAPEVEPHREDVPEDRAERDRVEHELARDGRVEADARDRQARQPRRGDDALADVDHHDPQREPLALRAERVRAAGIAAADPADIDAALQIADDQAAEHGAQQVRQREFQSELDHVRESYAEPGTDAASHASRRASASRSASSSSCSQQVSRGAAASTRPSSSSSSPRNTVALTRSPSSNLASRASRFRESTLSRSTAISTSPGSSPARWAGPSSSTAVSSRPPSGRDRYVIPRPSGGSPAGAADVGAWPVSDAAPGLGRSSPPRSPGPVCGRSSNP